MKLKKKTKRKILLSIFTVLLLLIFILSMIVYHNRPQNNKESNVITKSTIEKIINTSDVSTFETIYNGVVRVYNEKNTDKIDYYISYESKVQSGFDVKKVKVDMDKEKKIVKVTLPEIKLTDVTVDIGSLDYIFMDDKAETDTVSAEAYKKCTEDAKEKVKSQDEVADLAKENAANFIKAVTEPFVEQLGDEYQLVIE